MAWQQIDKAAWENYFDSLSKKIKAEKVEIEIMAMGVLDKEKTAWIPLYGISYDPGEKVLSVFCKGIDHLIRSAEAVSVHTTDAGIDRIEIKTGEGYKHVLRLQQPVTM